MNLNNVYDDGNLTDNPVLLAMYDGITTTLDEYYESLTAPSISMLLLPQDLDDIHKVVTSVKLSGNGEKRILAIRDIMARRGFTQLAGGTNRSVFTHPNYPNIAVKVAIDNVGIHDNPAEYNNQFVLKPYCTKCFEVSSDGAVGIFEKVGRIRNSCEFLQMWDDIYSVCEYFIGEKELLLEDFGVNFFMNWGIRYGYGPVLLDFPYVYDIDWDRLRCDKPNLDGSICHGIIDYDDGMNFLVCEKCGKRYRALDIAKKRDISKSVFSKMLGGKKMHIQIKRGDHVVKDVNSQDVSKVLGRPAVAKNWRSRIKSNDATGISSEVLKVKIVRNGETIEVNDIYPKTEKVNDSGIVVRVIRNGKPVNEEPEGEVVNTVDNIIEEVVEDEVVNDTNDDGIPVKEDESEVELLKNIENMFADEDKVEDVEEEKSEEVVSETVIDTPEIKENVVEVSEHVTVKEHNKEELLKELENSNSKRPAKKQKKEKSTVKTAAKKKETAAKKKPIEKKNKVTKASVAKPVEEVIVEDDYEDIKPALDTSEDTDIINEIVSTLDPYEAPVETEADIDDNDDDEVAKMVANKESFSPELIRRSNTKVTVDDILKNY